jgi:hypothetical protein
MKIGQKGQAVCVFGSTTGRVAVAREATAGDVYVVRRRAQNCNDLLKQIDGAYVQRAVRVQHDVSFFNPRTNGRADARRIDWILVPIVKYKADDHANEDQVRMKILKTGFKKQTS